MRHLLTILLIAFSYNAAADVERYTIDTAGSHAFINFKVSHLGISWVSGRFNTFQGDFSVSPSDQALNSVAVSIETNSLDTNHTDRDVHLKSSDFLNVAEFPLATFKSDKVIFDDTGKGKIVGLFTLNGVSRTITLDAQLIGKGKDPWGGYRRGYEATGAIKLSDFNIDYDLGPTAHFAELSIGIEGIRQ